MDIHTVTLEMVIGLIKDGEMTTDQIGLARGFKGQKAVNKRLRASGAIETKEGWDFSKIREEFLKKNFWTILEEVPSENKKSRSSLTQEEVSVLKTIASGYAAKDKDELKDKNAIQLIGELHLDQAAYNKGTQEEMKQLNVPIPITLFNRFNEFLNLAVGFEKRFVAKKGLEMFLDTYEPIFRKDAKEH